MSKKRPFGLWPSSAQALIPDEKRVWPVFLALLPKRVDEKAVGEIWDEAEAIVVEAQLHIEEKAQEREQNRRTAEAIEEELNSPKPWSEKRKALERMLRLWDLLEGEGEGHATAIDE